MKITLKTFFMNEEDRNSVAAPLLGLKKFSNLSSASFNDRKRLAYEEALDFIASKYVADDLYKSEYGDRYTYDISRSLEYIYDILHKNHESKFREIQGSDGSDLWGFSLTSSSKMLKIASKYKNLIPAEVIEFLELASKAKDSFKIIKAALKSGNRKSVEKKAAVAANPEAFGVRPMPSREAVQTADKFVREVVSGFEKELKEYNRKNVWEAFDRIDKATSKEELRKFISAGVAGSVFDRFFMLDRRVEKKFSQKPNVTSADVDKFADQLTKDVVEGFVAKNTSKLSLIFQKKSAVSSHKIMEARVIAGNVNAKVFVEFEDKSKFTVYSATEVSYSVHGKPFYRYPTRFKDVFMADGTKMSQPSEDKMIKEF